MKIVDAEMPEASVMRMIAGVAKTGVMATLTRITAVEMKTSAMVVVRAMAVILTAAIIAAIPVVEVIARETMKVTVVDITRAMVMILIAVMDKVAMKAIVADTVRAMAMILTAAVMAREAMKVIVVVMDKIMATKIMVRCGIPKIITVAEENGNRKAIVVVTNKVTAAITAVVAMAREIMKATVEDKGKAMVPIQVMECRETTAVETGAGSKAKVIVADNLKE
jgi:hypothetical protein